MIATGMFAETLGHLHHTTRINNESRSYTSVDGREKPNEKLFSFRIVPNEKVTRSVLKYSTHETKEFSAAYFHGLIRVESLPFKSLLCVRYLRWYFCRTEILTSLDVQGRPAVRIQVMVIKIKS